MRGEIARNEKIKVKLEKDIKELWDVKYNYLRAGLPRFGAFFGRDSCIASWQLIDYDSKIAENTIELLAKLQGKKINNFSEEEPGKIIHEWHPKPSEYKSLPWPLPYYGSVDATPLFIFLCGLYFDKIGDINWLSRCWPNILAALDWCEKYGDFDNDLLIEYERKNSVGLIHQGWKDSRTNHVNFKPPIELIEVQGYYFIALQIAEKFALMFKNEILAKNFKERAEKLKEAFIENFWKSEINFFAIALTESKFPDLRIASNAGHLLFTGILSNDKEKEKAVIERIFQDDMWTPYGIRTHAESNADFNPESYHLGSVWPHDNWIISQGLKKSGYNKEYNKIKNALIGVFEELGEIPELYSVVGGKIKKIQNACSPQAWASGALLNFILEK